MMDFKITEKGDLLFEEAHREDGITLSVVANSDNLFKLTFHLLSENDHVENNGLAVTFIHSEKSDLRHKAQVIRDLESKMQQIRIALMTELGELPNREAVGSELSRYRHGNIHDVSNQNNIKSSVLKALNGVLSDPSVTVTPMKNIGNFYSDNININIYEEGIRIFKFKI